MSCFKGVLAWLSVLGSFLLLSLSFPMSKGSSSAAVVAVIDIAAITMIVEEGEEETQSFCQP